MTYQTDCTLPDEFLEQLADQGLDVRHSRDGRQFESL